MTDRWPRFRQLSREIHDLGQVQALLEWDQQTIMPRKGVEQRSHALATLAALTHERLVHPELGELVATLSAQGDLDEDQRADLREMGRERDRAVRVPATLVAERARVCALAQHAWEEALGRDDFPSFRPHLERVLQLTRELAAALRTPDHGSDYDALLEEYEPGSNETDLRRLFDALRPPLVALLQRIVGSSRRPDRTILERTYPVEAQQAFAHQVIERMGFDFAAGRVDRSVHPFTSGTFCDVRITTRYRERFLPAGLFGMMHEAGHALYEQGLDPARYRDPAGRHCSLGIHESQSRLWENLIGRSRAFWEFFFPSLTRAFPGVLDDVTPDAFHAAVNDVRPSLIRVEADEVTYNLHIILRFQLETELIGGRLTVADLPDAWSEGMVRLLGLAPTSDREGAMQDVHWSAGLWGYFPTYALGNLHAAQLLEAARRDLPALDEGVARGELRPLKEWLNARVHRPGRRWLPAELCQRVTGQPLDADAALRHLERKLAEVYAL